MRIPMGLKYGLVLVAFNGGATWSGAEQRHESFDHEPEWDGLNNRSKAFDPRMIEQNFGYEAENRFGTDPGAIGGTITPAGKPAYYAKPVPQSDFDTPLSASGSLVVEKGAGNTLLGFFNADTVNEWRTPNSLVFRINGRGDFYHVHFEYATAKWRAGAGVIGRYDAAADRVYPLEIPSEGVHAWSLTYDPSGNDGGGAIVATFEDQRADSNLSEGHKADGAVFNRFGLLNVVKSADSPGKLWIGNVTINGEPLDLSKDPQWEGAGNRITYETVDIRPRFDFGFSPTQHAKGKGAGELGGLFFRGDCRYPTSLAYYGERIGPLTLKGKLRAAGKMVLLRAVSDSTTLFGFFNSEHSVQVNPSQNHQTPSDFLGLSIEGPSSEGFYVYPRYRVHGGDDGYGRDHDLPRVYPDGTPHDWTFEYDPDSANGAGEITLTLGTRSTTLPLSSGHKDIGATFDRFGFVTTWIDGNGQVVYVDDLEYTCKQ
ncbi:MAG: hypothetical protein HY706_03460 [Candidatus Hydrogenedentes bacterium]|nr:hypothetical protein [Candidatus Hydrogenedentota bacterium]